MSVFRNTPILLLLLLFTSSNGEEIQFKEIKRPYETVTPAIEKLLNTKDQSDADMVTEFWKNAYSTGLPLVEIDSLDDNYNYITIAYQDNRENLRVKLNVFGIYSDYHLGDRQLYRFKNTDLYYRCYMVPKDICFAYNYLITDTLTGEIWKKRDKFNKNRIPTGKEKNYSFSAFDLGKHGVEWNCENQKGLDSKIDTLVYIDKIVNRKHNLYIYLPSGYNHNKKYPVIYLFDAFIYLNRVEVPHILDNLIDEKKIEPMIAVMFGTYRDSRKILLPLNHEFKNEFVTDLLPIIRNKYSTSLKPENNIIGGMSYGGLAAFYISFYHPDIFGKVLSQSGSFWRDKVLTDSHDNEIRKDWLINQFLISEKKI